MNMTGDQWSSNERISYVVLHDQAGAVMHVHRHIALDGATPAMEELEATARRALERARPGAAAHLMALHAVTLPVLSLGSRFIIDPTTKEIRQVRAPVGRTPAV